MHIPQCGQTPSISMRAEQHKLRTVELLPECWTKTLAATAWVLNWDTSGRCTGLGLHERCAWFTGHGARGSQAMVRVVHRPLHFHWIYHSSLCVQCTGDRQIMGTFHNHVNNSLQSWVSLQFLLWRTLTITLGLYAYVEFYFICISTNIIPLYEYISKNITKTSNRNMSCKMLKLKLLVYLVIKSIGMTENYTVQIICTNAKCTKPKTKFSCFTIL